MRKEHLAGMTDTERKLAEALTGMIELFRKLDPAVEGDQAVEAKRTMANALSALAATKAAKWAEPSAS
jgi:hypothetical protein